MESRKNKGRRKKRGRRKSRGRRRNRLRRKNRGKERTDMKVEEPTARGKTEEGRRTEEEKEQRQE
jgi:hypothetical protein